MSEIDFLQKVCGTPTSVYISAQRPETLNGLVYVPQSLSVGTAAAETRTTYKGQEAAEEAVRAHINRFTEIIPNLQYHTRVFTVHEVARLGIKANGIG